MNRKIFTGVAAALLAATAALTVAGPAQAAPAPAAAPTTHVVTVKPVVRSGVLHSNGVRPNLAWKSYTWNTHFVGDCVMQNGATWTLYSDGTASFDGTVGSSDGGDAWLMWMHVKDTNGAELGLLTNSAYQDPNNPTKFVQNLQNAGWNYRWFAGGYYPSGWFNIIGSMSMESHC